jgi:hypothetical protein
MLKKYGRWYADWIDEHGNRKRKSFATRKAALKYQTSQRNAVAAKKAQAPALSRRSARRGRRPAAKAARAAA